MERLTYKNYIEEYEVNFEKSSDKNWSIAESDTHIKVTGEPIEKLGELEDVLESWHIENLEELKTRLHDCQVYHLKNNSNETLIHNLKNELAELKQKAIVLEKAFELACNPRDDWGGEKYSGTEFNNYHDYFIAEAEQRLAEIGEKDE